MNFKSFNIKKLSRTRLDNQYSDTNLIDNSSSYSATTITTNQTVTTQDISLNLQDISNGLLFGRTMVCDENGNVNLKRINFHNSNSTSISNYLYWDSEKLKFNIASGNLLDTRNSSIDKGYVKINFDTHYFIDCSADGVRREALTINTLSGNDIHYDYGNIKCFESVDSSITNLFSNIIDAGSIDSSLIDSSCIYIRNEIGSTNFETGNSGWNIKKDGSAEFQNMKINGTLDVYEYVLNKIRSTNGILLVTDTQQIASTKYAFNSVLNRYVYNIYFNEAAYFTIGDFIKIQRNLGGVDVFSFVGKVSIVYPDTTSGETKYGIGVDFIRDSSNWIVQKDLGDDTYVVRIGNEDASSNRANVIKLDPYSSYIDFISQMSDVSNYTIESNLYQKSKTRIGNLDGMRWTDPSGNIISLSEWGLYSDNAYLKGNVINTNGMWALYSNGSGQLCNGKIKWDASGNLTISQSTGSVSDETINWVNSQLDPIKTQLTQTTTIATNASTKADSNANAIASLQSTVNGISAIYVKQTDYNSFLAQYNISAEEISSKLQTIDGSMSEFQQTADAFHLLVDSSLKNAGIDIKNGTVGIKASDVINLDSEIVNVAGTLTSKELRTTQKDSSGYVKIYNSFIDIFSGNEVNSSDGSLYPNIRIGTDGTNSIISFYNNSGTFLYDLGPNGLTFDTTQEMTNSLLLWRLGNKSGSECLTPTLANVYLQSNYDVDTTQYVPRSMFNSTTNMIIKIMDRTITGIETWVTSSKTSNNSPSRIASLNPSTTKLRKLLLNYGIYVNTNMITFKDTYSDVTLTNLFSNYTTYNLLDGKYFIFGTSTIVNSSQTAYKKLVYIFDKGILIGIQDIADITTTNNITYTFS